MSEHHERTLIMKKFHHIGLPVADQATPVPGETWIAGGKLWLTNPKHHPQRVEWLRYGPGNTTDPNAPESGHICYEVDDVDAAIAGKTVISGPGEMGDPPFTRVAFTEEDGIRVEYISLYPGREWFDDPV
jgi:catechol 2,3-dioxygenase-like lactoylglutathione lyase family enzyme